MACVAPLLWAAMDWYVTGDPLHSLHGTADLAEAVDRRREPEQAPFWTLQYFGFVLREPVVIGLAVGLVFAWRFRLRPRSCRSPSSAVMMAVFMIGPFFGLPLIGRYVRTPSVLLALFYGLAVAGWLMLDPGRRRRVWMWVGIGRGGALDRLPAVARAHAGRRRAHAGAARARLRPTAGRGAVAAGRRRGALRRPVRPPTTASMPHLRWWLDCRRSGHTVEAGASPLQPVLVIPRDTARCAASSGAGTRTPTSRRRTPRWATASGRSAPTRTARGRWRAVRRRASGGALVDQHEDAVADDLRLREPQRAPVRRLLEGLLARPEDHREDHQVDLVDEVAGDQLLDEPVAARDLELAVELAP